MSDHTDVDPHTGSRLGAPLGRPGDARQIAAVLAFLAGPVRHPPERVLTRGRVPQGGPPVLGRRTT